MIPYTFADATRICGGTLQGADGNGSFDSVSIDTRTLRRGALYVPIHGLSLDGHRFIDAAFERGAVLTLSEQETARPHIRVKSCLDSIQALARDYRERFDIPVVGITGSVGKTTTKDMVNAVVSQRYNTLATKGNLNNQTGVPQVVFMLKPEHELAVMELGTNHFGEIDRLSYMSEPTICLFTCIGDAHVEFFGSREGILKGKLEMLNYAREGRKVIVNGDDPLLCAVPHDLCYGFDPKYDVYADEIIPNGLNGTSFTVHYGGKSFRTTVHAAGRHMVANALAAVAVGSLLGVPSEEMARGIENFTPPSGRMSVIEHNGITVLNGAYNSNPTSMQAAIEVLCEAKGRKVCIFGDMRELGINGPEYHRETGRFAADKGVDLLICVGELSQNAVGCGNTVWFRTQEEMLKALPKLIQKGDTVLVKASLSMDMAKTVKFLTEQ